MSSYLSLLVSGTLHSDGCIFPFLHCLSLLFFSQLFGRIPQTTILPSFISFSLGWFWSLPPVQRLTYSKCYLRLDIMISRWALEFPLLLFSFHNRPPLLFPSLPQSAYADWSQGIRRVAAQTLTIQWVSSLWPRSLSHLPTLGKVSVLLGEEG